MNLQVALRQASLGRGLPPLSLSIGAGERVALVGPNGSGKSTLLRALSGLAPILSGTLKTEGAIGYVPQDYRASLLPWFSVRRNLSLKVPLDELRLGAVLKVLPRLGALLDRHPERLSGGEQQLVVIGRALLGRPELLLFDEPMSALDAPTRLELRHALRAHQERSGATLLIVSHDLDEVAALADRALLLSADGIEELELRGANGVSGPLGAEALRRALGSGR